MPYQLIENDNLAPKPADNQGHALTNEEKLEEDLQNSINASDPPSETKRAIMVIGIVVWIYR